MMLSTVAVWIPIEHKKIRHNYYYNQNPLRPHHICNPLPTILHPDSYRKVYQKVAHFPPTCVTLSLSLGKHGGALRKIHQFRKLQVSQSPQFRRNVLHKLQISHWSLYSLETYPAPLIFGKDEDDEEDDSPIENHRLKADD
jgi:hypothetical protein